MKKFLVFTFFILLFSDAFSAHITGGEMIYQYLGPGAGNTKQYRPYYFYRKMAVSQFLSTFEANGKQ